MPPSSAMQVQVQAVAPSVHLVAYTKDPFRLAVASARTCYASDFVVVGALDKKGKKQQLSLLEALPQFEGELAAIGNLELAHDRRVELVEALQAKIPDKALALHVAAFADLARQRAQADSQIAHSIYEAGHHTPFQHPTFVFSLEGVSRHAVESFFHNHTFYNSEQQSQRYVEMKHADVHVPEGIANSPEAKAVYQAAISEAWETYHALRTQLVAANLKTMTAIGKIKGQSEKAIVKEAEKKSQEMARYVIPIAAATQLYHTVSGIVLLRYIRMCEAGDAPDEARAVVDAMVREVRGVDAGFVDDLQEATRPRVEHVERVLEGDRLPAPVSGCSQLVAYTPDAPQLVEAALREVTGSGLGQKELLATLLDPARNPALSDTLNTWDHSPALRTLRHVHYTFRKKLSLTAYAQDQRHRLTPGSRPLLRQCLNQIDVHVPDVIQKQPDALARYQQTIARLHEAIGQLRRLGITEDDVAYLLPNATHITFTQSGDLLSFIHKWRLRTCFNAQKEIFDASIEEVRQVQAVHPELTAFLGPPCAFVAARQPADKQDDVAACCPEGPRWCGVKVWKNFDAAKGTPKRPY